MALRRGWAGLLALLLLLLLMPQPALAEGGGEEGMLRATRLTSPQASFTGPFIGAVLSEGVLTSGGGLTLQADQATLEVDRSERPLVLDVAGTGIGVLPADETSTRAGHAHLDLEAMASDGQARVLVLALPGSAASAASLAGMGPLDVHASQGPTAEFAPAASTTRPSHGVPATGLALAGGTVQLRGDLRLVVTGLLLGGSADGQDLTVDTRRSDAPADGAPPGAPTRRSVAVEAVVDLRGATLRLPAGATSLAAALDIEAGQLDLAASHGRLGDVAAEGDDVQAQGMLRASVVPEGPSLVASVDGRLRNALVGPRAAAFDPSGPRAPGAWVVAGAGMAFLAAAVAHAAAGRARFHAVDRALGAQRYAEALALAGRFRLHPWYRQDATLAVALSLTELGRAAEARSRLLASPRWAPARQATRDFLLARAAARLGDRAETIRRLAASLLADPALLIQAKADPVLAPVVGPWTPAAVSRADAADAGATEAYA